MHRRNSSLVESPWRSLNDCKQLYQMTPNDALGAACKGSGFVNMKDIVESSPQFTKWALT